MRCVNHLEVSVHQSVYIDTARVTGGTLGAHLRCTLGGCASTNAWLLGGCRANLDSVLSSSWTQPAHDLVLQLIQFRIASKLFRRLLLVFLLLTFVIFVALLLGAVLAGVLKQERAI